MEEDITILSFLTAFGTKQTKSTHTKKRVKMEEKTKTQQSLRKPRENSHFSPSSSSCNLYLSRAPVSVSFIFHFPDLCPEILPVLADNPGLRNGTLFRPASPFVVTSHQRNTNNFSEHYFTFPQLFFFFFPFFCFFEFTPFPMSLIPCLSSLLSS